jgi:hypothetical protein
LKGVAKPDYELAISLSIWYTLNGKIEDNFQNRIKFSTYAYGFYFCSAGRSEDRSKNNKTNG